MNLLNGFTMNNIRKKYQSRMIINVWGLTFNVTTRQTWLSA